MMTIGPNNNHSSHHASPWDFMTVNATPSSPSEAEAEEASSSLAQSFQTKSPPDNFSHLSVSEILSTYKHDTDLMKHVLAAKAQEDRRKTAEEFRQMEEARLRFRFSDFDMDDYQKMDFTSIEKKDSTSINGTSSSAYSHQHTSHMFTESSLQAGKQYDQRDGSPHLDVLLSSPPPILMDQDTPSIYMENQHHLSTESISVLEAPVVQSHDYHLNVPTTSYSLPSSLSPSFINPSHFMSPSPNMGYSETDLKSTSSSCSSSVEAHSLLADLPPPVKISHPDNKKNSGTTINGNKANKKKASSPSASSKHRRGQSSSVLMPGFSSSTHVLRWAAPKKKRPVQPPIVNVNQEPQVPLDHDVVMNALRSKLMRIQPAPSSSDSIASSSPPPPSSSPPPTNYSREIRSPSPPPPPPPPRSPLVDTQPTTGILFLDLNNKSNRRKKAS
ncbi:hypothetical protein BCR42DRAFT_421759 [Absidia repens]|uniref:Uncharacterized protein n=1 Tax=Absidia repens TaxID=90262 RepID=A0A1X2I7X4_9FUNG|nr:hypothetical protein BCR42DRAFT_421759 [Absidia repens]